MLRTLALALLVLAPAAWGASIPSLPPLGGGTADPWLDAAGDTMFGDLHAGPFNVTFGGKPLGESSGLRYDGDLVCIQGVVACGSVADEQCDEGSFLDSVDGSGVFTCAPESMRFAGPGLALSNGTVQMEACDDGDVMKAAQADWACSEDDDTPFARTLVVAAGGSPADNGARLRATIANASDGGHIVVVEPGEFDVGDDPLVVGGGLVVAGSGRLSTRIVGTVEMSEGSMRDVGIVFDGDDCIVLRLTGGVVRLRDVAVETAGCRGMVVESEASVEFEGGIVTATASVGDLRAAIVNGSLVAREVTFEATHTDATARNVAVEVVGELTMTGGSMTTNGGGWTRGLLVSAAGAVFADDVTFEATITHTTGNVGAVDVRGRLRGGNLETITDGGVWGFGIAVETGAEVTLTGTLTVRGRTTVSAATLQGILANGTMRAGSVDLDVAGTVRTEGIVVDGYLDVSRLDLNVTSPDMLGTVRGIHVRTELVVSSGRVSLSGAGTNTILELDLGAVTRVRDVEVEVTFGSASVESRGVVSRGDLTWTRGSIRIETGSSAARGIDVVNGLVELRDVDLDVRGDNVTGIRIEPAARMLVDWIRANYSTEESPSPLRGVSVAGILQATRLMVEAAGAGSVDGFDVSSEGSLTLDASSVDVRTTGPAASAVGLRINGSAELVDTDVRVTGALLPGAIFAERGMIVVTRGSVAYDAFSSPVGVHVGNLANATLRGVTITGSGNASTSVRSSGPRLTIEDSVIEAKSQNGRGLHATAGNVTIDRSHILGLFRSAETQGATLRSYFTRYEGGQALVGAGQCAANVDRFGGFLQNGCGL